MLELHPKNFHLVAKKIKVFESELKKIFNVLFFAFSPTFFNMDSRGFFIQNYLVSCYPALDNCTTFLKCYYIMS